MAVAIVWNAGVVSMSSRQSRTSCMLLELDTIKTTDRPVVLCMAPVHTLHHKDDENSMSRNENDICNAVEGIQLHWNLLRFRLIIRSALVLEIVQFPYDMVSLDNCFQLIATVSDIGAAPLLSVCSWCTIWKCWARIFCLNHASQL